MKKVVFVLFALAIGLFACQPDEPQPQIVDGNLRLLSMTSETPVDFMGKGEYLQSFTELPGNLLHPNLTNFMWIRPFRLNNPRGHRLQFYFYKMMKPHSELDWKKDLANAMYFCEYDPVSRSFSNFSTQYEHVDYEPGPITYQNGVLPISILEMRLQEDNQLYIKFEHFRIYDWPTETWKSVVFEGVYELF